MPDMTGFTVAGNDSRLSIRCDFATNGNVVSAVEQKIQESKLDVKLKADKFNDDGVLTLLIGVVRATAYAVRNLIFDIINILNAQRLTA